MVEISVIEEKPVSMAELKEFLDSKKKEKKELNFRENKSLEYINSFVKLKKDKALELKKELESLDVIRLREKHIIKLIDLVPTEIDDLKMIFSGEGVTLKSEDLNKIIDIIKKYA